MNTYYNIQDRIIYFTIFSRVKRTPRYINSKSTIEVGKQILIFSQYLSIRENLFTIANSAPFN